MLSKPKSGWTTFSLVNNEYDLSYLTDVALEWIEQAIHGLETLHPFTVHGFLEPGRMICVVSYWNIHIFVEDDENVPLNKEDNHYETIHMTMIDFCEILYNDIKENIVEWIDWFCDDRYDLKKREIEINKKLDKLHKLIDEKKKHFGLNRYFL